MSTPQAARRPLSAVLDAIGEGIATTAGLADATGLHRDVVEAAIDQLVRMGRLEAKELATGCPPAGCGGCASGKLDGTPGCGSAGPSARRRGPVLVALQLRRPS